MPDKKVFWKLILNERNKSKARVTNSRQPWYYTNHPVALYTNSVIDSKIEYIHQNPVRAGIVTQAEYYKYSSACFDSPLKVLEW